MWRLLFVIILLSACTYKKRRLFLLLNMYIDTLRYISYTGEIQAFLSLKMWIGKDKLSQQYPPTGFYLDTYEHVSNLVESGDFIQPSSTLPDILQCHTIYRLLIRAHWQRCYSGYIQDILKIELRRNGFMSILFIYLRYVMLYKLSYSIHWRMTDSRSRK